MPITFLAVIDPTARTHYPIDATSAQPASQLRASAVGGREPLKGPSMGTAWTCLGCGGLLFFLVLASLLKKKRLRCGLCGVLINRNYYQWKVQGKRLKLCPNCNQEMARRMSKAAFDRLDRGGL